MKTVEDLIKLRREHLQSNTNDSYELRRKECMAQARKEWEEEKADWVVKITQNIVKSGTVNITLSESQIRFLEDMDFEVHLACFEGMKEEEELHYCSVMLPS